MLYVHRPPPSSLGVTLSQTSIHRCVLTHCAQARVTLGRREFDVCKASWTHACACVRMRDHVHQTASLGGPCPCAPHARPANPQRHHTSTKRTTAHAAPCAGHASAGRPPPEGPQHCCWAHHIVATHCREHEARPPRRALRGSLPRATRHSPPPSPPTPPQSLPTSAMPRRCLGGASAVPRRRPQPIGGGGGGYTRKLSRLLLQSGKKTFRSTSSAITRKTK